MKKFFSCIIFLLIFLFLFSCTFNILWIRKESIAYFFEEKKNSFDVVYIGASNAFVHFNTTQAYNTYGYTTGLLAANTQPFASVKYLIKESEKTQRPKLYVVDIARVVDDFKKITEGAIRTTTDSMKFSLNRINAINEILDYKGTKKSSYINFYFSFVLWHNKWKDIGADEGYAKSNFYKGFLCIPSTVIVEPQTDEHEWIDDKAELPEDNKKVLMELLDYIKSKNLNVLFVIPNRIFSDEDMQKLNTACSIIKENNYEVINSNLVKDLKIDYNTDLYNSSHLNVYGATKYTTFFSKYLKEHYDLPDHRNEEGYDSWKQEYERFKKDFNKLTGKNFDDLLEKDT